MSKRARDLYERESPTPSSRPAKRAYALRQTASSPIRPRRSSIPSTPFAYCTARTPLSVPQDSPTNPFGLKRSLTALELPRVTSFGKHIGLRFQLVDTRPSRDQSLYPQNRTGVFRVVQVPLNYTFRHLHKLILYLFASDINEIHSQLPSARKNSLRSASTTTASQAKGKGRATDIPGHGASKQWGGHFFECMKQVNVSRDSSSKPGVILPGGKIHTKLSSVRERRLFKDLLDPEDAAASTSASDLPKALEDEDVETEDWKWEAEDDFTLGQVWKRGPSLDRGIIYHHQPNIAVHITANTLVIESRKGNGNTPFVFLAQGTAGPLVRIAHVAPTDDGGEAVFDLDHHDYDHGPLMITKTHIDRWNKPDAFETFLRREAERERMLQRRSTSPPPLSVSAVHHRVVPPPRDVSEAPTALSSDPPLPSSEGDSELSDASACSASAYSDSALFPFAFSAITPYPAHPLHRKRVQRAERRMARLTKSGLVDMLSSDEEDAKKKAKEKPPSSKPPSGKGKERGTTVEVKVEEEQVDLSAKENVRTYAHRPVKAYMRGGRAFRGSHRPIASRAGMDIIEWTPPSQEEERYSRLGYASVEV